MKKIAFLASLMCATMAMAAPAITSTSQVNLSTAGQTDKYVRFVLSDSFSNGFDNTWDTPAANESGIYVFFGGARYTGWASNEYSENLQIGFYANDNLDYTLTFSNFKGEEYEIFDRVTEQTIIVNASTPAYNFSIDESEKNLAINDRFIINPKSQKLDILLKGKDGELLISDGVDLLIPIAPEFEGFIFQGWFTVAGPIEDGIVLQAVYISDEPTSAPEVVVNPANPSQKLVRNGQVYILRDNATYTLQGQMVK